MENVAEVYDQLVAQFSDIERKGAKMPYTSMNGNMFSFITQEGRLAIRLGKDDYDALLESGGEICEQHGRVMKEYVAVPDSMVGNGPQLKKWFEKSVEHAKSLKPKPTKRKAKKKT